MVYLPRFRIIYFRFRRINWFSFEYEYHGGSAGGLQDYSVRAWFNTTEEMDIYVRVYTDQPDDVMYNLSVLALGYVEDDYHWVALHRR